MKQKYLIRETSVPFNPPYTPLYFHGFTSRGAGVCMVFGSKLAQEYDTLEAATKIMVKVKELSGRDTWEIDPRFNTRGYCQKCGQHAHAPGEGCF